MLILGARSSNCTRTKDTDVRLVYKGLKMVLSQEDLLPSTIEFNFNKMIEQNNFTLTKGERDTRYDLALMTEIGKTLESGHDILEQRNIFIAWLEAIEIILNKTHLEA